MSYRSAQVCTVLLTVALAAGTAPGASAAPLPGVTVLVGPSLNGGETERGSFYQDASKNGRYIVFESDAADLVPITNNNETQVYLSDTKTGRVSAITVTRKGTMSREGAAGWSALGPRITADGRYVAFTSPAADLVPGDTNGSEDGFVRDLRTGTTKRVTLGRGRVQADGGASNPVVSDNGRYVVFDSGSSNLVPGVKGAHIYRRDLKTGAVVAVDVRPNGKVDPSGLSAGETDVSGDGRYVVFSSLSSKLVKGKVADPYRWDRVYRRDVKKGTTKAVSPAVANGHAGEAKISADGRYVVWQQQVDGYFNVFAYDSKSGKTTRLDKTAAGKPTIQADAGLPSISADGRYVAFDDFDALDNNWGINGQVYVVNRRTGAVRLASATPSGKPGNAISNNAVITPDGRSVAFISYAGDLTGGNGEPAQAGQIFLRQGK